MNRGATWSQGFTPNEVPPDPVNRAVDTWTMIMEKPAVVVIQRRIPGSDATVELPAQTVRLEVIQNIRESNELRDAWVNVSRQYVELIGMKDHPTIPNCNIQRSDTFFYLNRVWEITEVIDNIPGRLLANGNLQP